MANDNPACSLIFTVQAITFCFIGSEVRADDGGLEGFIGQWQVRVETMQPEKTEVTYSETYEWVLDHQFLKGQTGSKSDGSRDVIFATYDAQLDGYPFWIFSSSGTYLNLPPATWNARERMMEWKSPGEWDITYKGYCHFPDEKKRYCNMITKDWKGKVLLEQQWTAVRNEN